MHTPDPTPRASVFYHYAIHPFRPFPADLPRPKVVIVGAGPIGMATALDLARFGVASVILESELQVSHGSRAIVLTRRSMEILQQIGVAAPFVAKGLQWSEGRSFYRGQQVYRMVMPHDPDDAFLPGLNLQQQYIEQYLVEAIAAQPLIDLRWGCKVEGLSQDAQGVTLSLDTPEGPCTLAADWVVAADGGRSTIRKLLGLRMEGRSYSGNFVIADILAPISLPTERLCFFDPDWNPGNNVLVHRQPDSLWRIDFRLPDGESPEAALDPARLGERIEKVLAMIGQPVPWTLDWATVYSANTLTLPDYRAGRVLFIGDAAHLLPIFGVRGANTGFQDGNDLAWKLAFVVNGLSDPSLLDSFSHERVRAAREICDEGGKSTRFMNPPSAGFRVMRDAVLSLSLSQEFPKDLLHWRTSRPHVYADSPLNSFAAEDEAFAGGVEAGGPLRNVRLGDGSFLFEHLGHGVHLLAFAGRHGPDEALAATLRAAQGSPAPTRRVVVAPVPAAVPPGLAEVVIPDPDGRVSAKYAASPGAAYLVRPDMHVAARWPAVTPQAWAEALAICIRPAQGARP